MYSFNLKTEQVFDPKKHMEKVLGTTGEGDVTIACWEPGQTSPYHCHPDATEIYFCFEGGGTMRTPTQAIAIEPGAFVVHPRGELHEYVNGPQRTLLFRVRYGDAMSGRTKEWPSNLGWKPRPEDLEYFQKNISDEAEMTERNGPGIAQQSGEGGLAAPSGCQHHPCQRVAVGKRLHQGAGRGKRQV